MSDEKERCEHFEARHSSLSYRRRFFAFALTEIIQFRATGFTFGFDFDFRDPWRIDWKNAFDAFAIGNSAHGEVFIYASAFPSDDNARENLDPFLVPLDHASVHTNAVANFKTVGVALLLFLFDDIENAVHNPASGEGAFTLLQARQKASSRAFVIVDPANYNRHLARP